MPANLPPEKSAPAIFVLKLGDMSDVLSIVYPTPVFATFQSGLEIPRILYVPGKRAYLGIEYDEAFATLLEP